MRAELLTVSAVAARLVVSPDTVLALIHAGRLAASNVGLGAHRPRWRITSEAVEQFLDSRAAPAKHRKRRKRPNCTVTEFF